MFHCTCKCTVTVYSKLNIFSHSFSECCSFHGDHGCDGRAWPCFDPSKIGLDCRDRCQRGRLAAGGSDFRWRPVVLVRSGKHMWSIDPKHITVLIFCALGIAHAMACLLFAGQARTLLPFRWTRAVPLTRMWHLHCRSPPRSRTRGHAHQSLPHRIKPVRSPSQRRWLPHRRRRPHCQSQPLRFWTAPRTRYAIVLDIDLIFRDPRSSAIP